MRIWVDASTKLKRLAVVGGDGVPFAELYNEEWTNNEAEYHAILLAVRLYPGEHEIVSDSLLAVMQLNKKWAIRNDRLLTLARRIWTEMKGQTISWCLRAENRAGVLLG